MPGLPGIATISRSPPPRRRVRTSACSRAPPPMTTTFVISVPEVTYAGEDHGQPEPIGSRDHLVVAHRSAWLRDRGHAGPRGRLHAVWEREERVGAQGRSPRFLTGALRGDPH